MAVVWKNGKTKMYRKIRIRVDGKLHTVLKRAESAQDYIKKIGGSYGKGKSRKKYKRGSQSKDIGKVYAVASVSGISPESLIWDPAWLQPKVVRRRSGGTRYVYDQAEAQRLRKEEYLKHLGIYGTALSKLDPFKIPRTQLGGRPQKRFGRGAQRGAGLPGRKQRKSIKQSSAYKAHLKQAKAGLQRYKEDIESYRSQWGL